MYHDRNGSDLILNYQFSDETESKLEEGAILIEGEEPEDQPKVDLSFISDVFQLLPFVLALFTLTGESTDFLQQRVQQDQCDLLEHQEQSTQQNAAIDDLKAQLANSLNQQASQSQTLEQIRQDKDSIILQTSKFS